MTILNFHSTVVLSNSGRWTSNLQSNINAKLAVIRQITYCSTNATKALYQIHSSLSHDVIGSVHNGPNGFVSNPERQIKLSNPNVGYIEFWLTSQMLPIASVATDQISIEIDLYDEHDLKLIKGISL